MCDITDKEFEEILKTKYNLVVKNSNSLRLKRYY